MMWIALVVVLIGVVGAALFFVPDAMRRSQRSSVAQTGVPAQARIVAVADTGRRYATNPVVRFSLEVRPAAGETFEASIEQEVSMVELPRLQPGAIVTVRFDPADRSRLAIVGSSGNPQ